MMAEWLLQEGSASHPEVCYYNSLIISVDKVYQYTQLLIFFLMFIKAFIVKPSEDI